MTRCRCVYDKEKKRLIAFYEGTADAASLRAHALETLPPFMMPTRILPIEAMPYDEYRSIFLALLHKGGTPEYFFDSDAPPHVELTAFTERDRVMVNAVALDEETVSRPVEPFEIRVRCHADYVKLLPQGEPVDFETKDGYTVFRTRTLRVLDMYELGIAAEE